MEALPMPADAPRARPRAGRRPFLATALFSGAIFLAWTGSTAQNTSTPPSAAATARGDCISRGQPEARDLYGNWVVQWHADGAGRSLEVPATELLRLSANPSFPESLAGTLRRGEQRLQLSGDLEDGQLELEESLDGKSIHATWTAQLGSSDCLREIQGRWQLDEAVAAQAGQARSRRFTLRRAASGW